MIEGKNRYCGPAAVALLTGVTTDDASRILRDVTGRRAVRGVWSGELQSALRRFFGTVYTVYSKQGATLKQVARTLAPGSYVINVTGHYVAAVVSEGGRVKVGDNKAGGWTRLRGFSGNRKRVKRVFYVAGLNKAVVRREKTEVKRRSTAWRELERAAKRLVGYRCLRDVGDETEVVLDPGFVLVGEGTHGARSLGATRAERARDLLTLISGGTEPCVCDDCCGT